MQGGSGSSLEARLQTSEANDAAGHHARHEMLQRHAGGSVEIGIQVQQELMPRVAVNVGYNRRWFQNFFVTDNQSTAASDYDKWNLTVPNNPLLPTAGQTLTYYNISQAASNRPAFALFACHRPPSGAEAFDGFSEPIQW